MAKLFGADYHAFSNSWYFKSSVRNLKKDDLEFKKFLDENGAVVFEFRAAAGKENKFLQKLELVYDKSRRKIIQHTCSDCGREECRHYLTVLNYAYNYLSTSILDEQQVQTYQTKMLEYNEFWQQVELNSRIEISDLFNKKNDKIRFHMKSYRPMNIRLIAILLADWNYKEDDIPEIGLAEKQIKALSEDEIALFITLQNHKCSFSRKGSFFTVYKRDLIHFFTVMKSLADKIYIKETGDLIRFSEKPYRLNFLVSKNNNSSYILRPAASELVSAAYLGKTSYIFKKNIIHAANFPFTPEVAKKIFSEGYELKDADLVYLFSVVSRQLSLIKCYLDLEEGIELPQLYNSTPLINFKLHKEEDDIVMDGSLQYAADAIIPMNVIRFPAELVRYDQADTECWFYIPPQIKYEVRKFMELLPESQSHRLESKSQLIFNGEENISRLKKVIFEQAKPDWEIELSDELKQEFIYRVNLKPVINTRRSDTIDWFEYDVQYNYKDISFSHAELRQFFASKENFLRLEDGRMLFFENKQAFQQIDDMIEKSEQEVEESYKLAIYNLPYVYQLSTVNENIRVQGDQYLSKMFEAILHRKLPELQPLSQGLRPIMRSYQKAGFHWLTMLKKFGLSGILADDMGLGKTIQAISVLTSLPSDSISIIICPKTLLFNWAAEIEKFSPALSYVLYEGNIKERQQILENLQVNIIFASYSIIQNDIEYLNELNFDYIILDEAQHIKNATAQRTKAIKKLKARHKMALSGTPIENNPTELWSIFDFLMPGYLPELKTFKRVYMSQDEHSKEALQKLKLLISPFILRRRKQEVLIELPDKQIQTAYCKMAPLQEKMYLQILEKVKRDFLAVPGKGDQYIHILAALTKLRQVCNHPGLLDDDILRTEEFSGKTALLKEIISDAVEGGKKLLIFSQFVQMLKILKQMLSEMEIQHEYMDGSTKDRQKAINNFNENNNVRAFLVSLKTGGFGLNLTAADTVIIVDPWWNPMGENQAIDRAHRIGQTKKVNVYKIITKGTIEEKILDLQLRKTELFENLIEGGSGVLKTLTTEDLKNLLEY
ncbi:MAG: SNF2-related protein [Candidatus Cloacimonadales bacterium]